MTIIHVIVMYVLMFAMIDRGTYFYNNINMFYMAILMAAPISLVMMISMRHMYQNKKLNLLCYALFIVLGLSSYGAIRFQTAVGNTQFLRSMIPHHSGAILMCREANIKDAEITALCKNILESQQKEIDQMEAILKR